MFRFLTTLMLFAAAVFSVTLHGQSLTVKASKTKAAVGEQIQLSYIMQGNASEFTQPNLSAFDILSGPNQSITAMDNMNGTITMVTTIYYVITPKKKGSCTIKRAKATINNKKMETEELVIEATEALQAPQQNSNVTPYNNSNQQYYTPQSNTYNSGNSNTINPSNSKQTVTEPAATSRDYFITYSVDKTKAFIGEQIHLAVKLYTRFDARGPDAFDFPTTEGFWKYDAPKSSTAKKVRENIDGVNYMVYVIFENFLFPQKAGEIIIEPATMKCRILKPADKTGNWWEDFMNNGMAREVPVTLTTQQLKISVEALPEIKPDNDFSGAVGDYSLKSEITRNRVNENEALNVRVTLNGRGNLKLIDPPKLELSKNFEAYEPTTSEAIDITNTGVNGTKTYDFTIVARNACNDTIPAMNFTYFDDKTNKYVSLNTGSFAITVDPADPAQKAEMVSNYAAKNNDSEEPETLRALKTAPLAVLPDHTFFGSVPFYLLLVTIPVLFFLFVWWYRRKQKREADVAGTRIRMAGKIARQRLVLANEAMLKNEPDRFYEELSKAIYDYLAHKTGLLQSQFSQEGIRQVLETHETVSAATLTRLLRLAGDAEFARYAPAAAGSSLKERYDEAEACINELEKELNSK